MDIYFADSLYRFFKYFLEKIQEINAYLCAVLVKSMEIEIWQIIYIVVILIIIGLIRLFFSDLLQQTITNFFSDYQAQRTFKGGVIIYSQFNILGSALFFFSIGFMLYRANEYFMIITLWQGITNILIIILSYVLFTYLKMLVYFLLGFITGRMKITNEFLFNWININHVEGIVLAVVSIVLAFTNKRFLPFFIWAGIFFWTYFYLYRIARGLKIIFRKKIPLFYILLYLCTLEFLPALAIFQLLGK